MAIHAPVLMLPFLPRLPCQSNGNCVADVVALGLASPPTTPTATDPGTGSGDGSGGDSGTGSGDGSGGDTIVGSSGEKHAVDWPRQGAV